MTKIRKGNKEARKQPQLNPKEKKAKKHEHKQAGGTVPFLPAESHH